MANLEQFDGHLRRIAEAAVRWTPGLVGIECVEREGRKSALSALRLAAAPGYGSRSTTALSPSLTRTDPLPSDTAAARKTRLRVVTLRRRRGAVGDDRRERKPDGSGERGEVVGDEAAERGEQAGRHHPSVEDRTLKICRHALDRRQANAREASAHDGSVCG